MKTSTALRKLLVIGLMIGATFAQARGLNDYPKLAPFSAVQWEGWTPSVQVDSRWYELVSLNDVPASEIVAFW